MKKISLGSWAFAFGPYASDPVPFDRSAKRLAEAEYDKFRVRQDHEFESDFDREVKRIQANKK